MVLKGNIYTIEITDVSTSGEGIGRAESMVVFVPGTVPGRYGRRGDRGGEEEYRQGQGGGAGTPVGGPDGASLPVFRQVRRLYAAEYDV